MIEQDYIMRQIKEMIAVIMKVLFGRELSSAEQIAAAQSNTDDPVFRMVDSGNIREAETLLYDNMHARTAANLLKGFSFYEYVLQHDEAFLDEHKFSRTRIEDGIKRLASLFGAAGIADIFFPD